MNDPASGQGSAAEVAAGPEDQAAKIAELEARVKKQDEFLEKAKAEHEALGEERKKRQELEARMEAVNNPSTNHPTAQQPSQAEANYYRDLIAEAAAGKGWAIAELKRMEQDQQHRAEVQWKLDLASLPEAIRDEVDKEARARRIPLGTAREIVDLRKKAERAQALEAEAEELRKDKQAGQKPDIGASASTRISAAEAKGAMPMSEWSQKASAAREKWNESKHTDRAAYDELQRLANIRDQGLIVMNR